MLRIENLCKSYEQRRVLHNLNLYIPPGEIYGLLGPNGAGKTTTINILCHLLQADSGRVTIDNQPISETTKSLIGLAPQENLIYTSLTCAENLNFFARLYGLPKQQRVKRVPACLEAVGLADRSSSVVETLSGGMQRRLSLAIALVHHPKLLILDEPTTGLDMEARSDIWQLLWQLQNQGLTVLLTTHLLDEAEQLCERIGILKQGSLLVEGSFAQLRQYIPAQEILLVRTHEEDRAIARAQAVGLSHRRYSGTLAFLLPKAIELKEIINYFDGIPLDSITRQPVGLEHIYDEVSRSEWTGMPSGLEVVNR
ncbi:MAG: ABC transporter ATP-binding protein [Chroococcidiopsidaceae cyanobacterium CP_BM_RX_35]|nr:ABC transporter ATP-binding protein [Chroococcidiopsidaceae cyanobacterium CP_BM_RX_35]